MANKEDFSPSILLVTANVGSLFEDSTRLLKPWLKEFLQKIEELQPQFIALHLQEVGGKTYEKSMEHVQEFIHCLCDAKEMIDYGFMHIYMDEDFNSAEHFTALGNLYFAHKSLSRIKIWNFITHEWTCAENKHIFNGNIEKTPTKEKSKFPQHFFPECKWSRKGYMRTRWDINGTVIDFVNIHLFHDASNLAACEEFPSVYCKTRRRALIHTLERFHLDNKNTFVPYFIFGDFNFRCDTEGVIKELTDNLTVHRVQSSKTDSTKIYYRNSIGENVLTIGKKEFNYTDHQLKFKAPWLKKHDRELDIFNEILVEYPIKFPPSYPYEEDPNMPSDYMSTRCPSWCDRILMSPEARKLIMNDCGEENVYDIIGRNVCMGDHKPIYLNIRLKPNQVCQTSAINQGSKINNLSVSRINENKRNVCIPGKNPYSDHEPDMINIPPVSIHIVNSENSNVCICFDNKNPNDNICSECENIIQKQPADQQYRIMSRVVMSNNIIVNSIDSQYLNTYFDPIHRSHEPYTPESTESHSPYPELCSAATTSANLNPYDNSMSNEKQKNETSSEENLKKCSISYEKGLRGFVSPGQLKLRLEDLQRSSLSNNNNQNDDASRDSDVEDICQANIYKKRQNKSCLSDCCNI